MSVIPLREFRNWNPDPKDDEADRTIGTCQLCDKPIIHPSETEKMGDGKLVHRDCYYEELGNVIERHPIVSPRSRG